ncbi:MAG: recombination regulator RecX [Candidatus Omnitrophica bacterium]|nr:recombination regulator RecX [Candidatus Omnitrophota bacterium]
MEDIEKAKNYALKLLKYRPRTQKEIFERLIKKKYPQDLIEKVVQELKEAGLLNDREFVKFWINWRREVNPRSKNFIFWELRKKGVSEDLIKEKLEEINSEDDFSQAEQLAKKQFERLKDREPEKKKIRIYGYLKRRGFAESIIYDILNNLFKNRE